MNKNLLILLISCAMLSGCSSTKAPDANPYQEILLVPCSKDTPIPKGLTGKDALDTLEEWQKTYDKCAVMHDATIKAIRERQHKI